MKWRLRAEILRGSASGGRQTSVQTDFRSQLRGSTSAVRRVRKDRQRTMLIENIPDRTLHSTVIRKSPTGPGLRPPRPGWWSRPALIQGTGCVTFEVSEQGIRSNSRYSGNYQMEMVGHDGRGMELPSAVACCFQDLLANDDCLIVIQPDRCARHPAQRRFSKLRDRPIVRSARLIVFNPRLLWCVLRAAISDTTDKTSCITGQPGPIGGGSEEPGQHLLMINHRGRCVFHGTRRSRSYTENIHEENIHEENIHGGLTTSAQMRRSSTSS